MLKLTSSLENASSFPFPLCHSSVSSCQNPTLILQNYSKESSSKDSYPPVTVLLRRMCAENHQMQGTASGKGMPMGTIPHLCSVTQASETTNFKKL